MANSFSQSEQSLYIQDSSLSGMFGFLPSSLLHSAAHGVIWPSGSLYIVYKLLPREAGIHSHALVKLPVDRRLPPVCLPVADAAAGFKEIETSDANCESVTRAWQESGGGRLRRATQSFPAAARQSEAQLGASEEIASAKTKWTCAILDLLKYQGVIFGYMSNIIIPAKTERQYENTSTVMPLPSIWLHLITWVSWCLI